MNSVTLASTIVVTGAGGFIGGHLVKTLCTMGYQNVRAIYSAARTPPLLDDSRARWLSVDLLTQEGCEEACSDADVVFHLAAEMGGIQWLKANPMTAANNAIMSMNMLKAANLYGVKRFFFASSACAYPKTIGHGCMENAAIPANPATAYGWEKIFTEQIGPSAVPCFITARFHTVFGPHCHFTGGKEKVVAALCRQVALVKRGELQGVLVQGDGNQSRPVLWVSDAIAAILKMVDLKITEPLNIGHQTARSINDLLTDIETAAGCKVRRFYELGAEIGDAFRPCPNERAEKVLGWSPQENHLEAIKKAYNYVEKALSQASSSLPVK